MAKKLKGDQVLTGQLLREGIVVFLTEDNSWTLDLQQACVGKTAEEVSALEQQAELAVKENIVIDAYPFVVLHDADGKIIPAHIREKVRTDGPSISYLED